MKNQHSPGPFEIGSEYSNTQDEIVSADGRTVAVVWTRQGPSKSGAHSRSSYKDDPELKANLALFAAAPELLAALEAWQAHGFAVPISDHPEAVAQRKIHALVKSAIAKAKGNQ